MFVSNSRYLLCVLVVCLPVLGFAGAQQETPAPSTSSQSPTTAPSSTLAATGSPSALPATDAPSTSPTTTTDVASSEPTAPATDSPTVSPPPPTTTPTIATTNPIVEAPTTVPASTTNAPSGPTWSGCVEPNGDNGGLVTIGDPTIICLTVGPGGNWANGVNYIRWVFRPEADRYSRFHIPDSFNDLVSNAASSPLGDRNLTVHTASQDFLSFLRVYYDPVQKRIFPYLTAIIDVDDGVVTGIAWDNACVFCSGGRCVENTFDFAGTSSVDLELDAQTKGCYLSVEECAAVLFDTETGSSPSGGYEASEGNTCDITLYVVWTGTDSKGNAFQSSGYRFGAFPEARLQDRVRNNLPDFPDFDNINPFL